MGTYSFAQVLQHTGVMSARVQRWCDAGIIETAGGGSQGKRREFSLRNLVEIIVCDELRELGVDELLMADVVRNLKRFWNGGLEVLGTDADRSADPTFYLWIGHVRISFPPDETIHDTFKMQFVNPARLIAILTDGADGSGVAETGITVPLSQIIADLERATGDTFDLESTVRRKLAEALRNQDHD